MGRHRDGYMESRRLRYEDMVITWRKGDMEIWRHGHGDIAMEPWTWRLGIKILDNSYILRKKIKRKTKAQAIFLNPFTVCSFCKRKFVFSQFVD